jgi:hypothetical protein
MHRTRRFQFASDSVLPYLDSFLITLQNYVVVNEKKWFLRLFIKGLHTTKRMTQKPKEQRRP